MNDADFLFQNIKQKNLTLIFKTPKRSNQKEESKWHPIIKTNRSLLKFLLLYRAS